MCIGEKARAIEKEIKEVLGGMNDKFKIEIEEVEVCIDSWGSYGKEQFENVKADVLIKIGNYDKNINVLWVIERVLDDVEKEWEVKFMGRCVRV